MKAQRIEKYHHQKDKPKERQFDIYDLNDYHKNNADHLSIPHTHSFYQLIWFKSSEGLHFVDFEGHEIKKDTIFFIAKNQVHYFENRADYEGYLIHFNESFIVSNETDLNFFLTYHIFNNTKPLYRVTSKNDNDLTSYINQMKKESSRITEFGNVAILSNLLKSFLLLIEREIRTTMNLDATKLHQNNTFFRFRDLLENNFDKNWSVADFADKLLVSTKTLNTITKSELGKTVSQVVIDRIILESKRRLTHSNAFVKEIAYDLGFSDPSYFIKYFKKHVNCSPSEFRKSIS